MDKVEGQKVSLKVPLGKAEGFCTRRDTSCSNDLGMDEKRLRLSVSISRRFSAPRPSGSSDIPMQANYLYRKAHGLRTRTRVVWLTIIVEMECAQIG